MFIRPVIDESEVNVGFTPGAMKKKHFLRYAALFVTILFMLTFLPLISFAAGSDSFDFDVILVVDTSGSMRRTDPDNLARTAANMFIDLGAGSDSRVGYVIFHHEVAAELPLTHISDADLLAGLRNSIARTALPGTGQWTNIPLALDRAFDLLESDSLGGRSPRIPVVILLSDGNTAIRATGPVSEVDKEATEREKAKYASILAKYADAGVPIEPIGLNDANGLQEEDEVFDLEELRQIAGATGGVVQEVTSADMLPRVMRNVYGRLTGSVITDEDFFADGPTSRTITVDNDSIYKATITLFYANPVTDLILQDPSGTPHSGLANVVVSTDPSSPSRYTIFTIFTPERGDWVLSFVGNGLVNIALQDVYDFVFVMQDPIPSVEQAQVTWHLEDSNGNEINDPDLINSLTVTFHANGGDFEIPFPQGSTSETLDLPPGDYEAHLTLTSTGTTLADRPSNSKSFTVPGAPLADGIKLDPLAEDTITVNLTTIFDTERVIPLDEHIVFTRDNEPLTVTWDGGDWEDFIAIEFDDEFNEFIITALDTGSEEAIALSITGSDGSSLTLYLDVNVGWGLLYIIIGAGILLLLIIGAVVFMMMQKPFLDSPMRDFAVEVKNMPEGYEYPQATRFRLEHVKGKKTLQDIINYNRQYANEYFGAFRDIGWFLTGTEFYVKQKGILNITIPVNPRVSLQVNGNNMQRPYTGVLSKNSETRVGLYLDEHNMYEIVFGESGFSQGPDPFNEGGFGVGGGFGTGSGFDVGSGFDIGGQQGGYGGQQGGYGGQQGGYGGQQGGYGGGPSPNDFDLV